MELQLNLKEAREKNADMIIVFMLITISVMAALNIFLGPESHTTVDVEFIVVQGIAVLILLRFRKLLSTDAKIFIFIMLWMAFMSMGLLRKSLFSASTSFLSFGPLLISFLVTRVTYRIFFISMATTFAAIAIFMAGKQPPLIDVDKALRISGNWINEAFIIFMGTLAVILVHQRNQVSLRWSLDELDKENKNLGKRNDEIRRHQVELEEMVSVRSVELLQAIKAYQESNRFVAERNLENSMRQEGLKEDLIRFRELEGAFRRSVRQATVGRLAKDISSYFKRESTPTTSAPIGKDRRDLQMAGFSKFERMVDRLAAIQQHDTAFPFDLSALLRTAVVAIRVNTNIRIRLHTLNQKESVMLCSKPVLVDRVVAGILSDLSNELSAEQQPLINIEATSQPDAAAICLVIEIGDAKRELPLRISLIERFRCPENPDKSHWKYSLQLVGGRLLLSAEADGKVKAEIFLPDLAISSEAS